MADDKQIDAKKAVALAIAYLKDIYADSDVSDVLLEEIERRGTTDDWVVTLSFARKNQPLSNIAILGGLKERLYKQIAINGSTGDILSMRIRDTPRNA